MELEKWKKEIEYDLNKLNNEIDKLEKSYEELKLKKQIVTEACDEYLFETPEEKGYIFTLKADLHDQIVKKEKLLFESKTNPNRLQLELLLKKIERYISIEEEEKNLILKN